MPNLKRPLYLDILILTFAACTGCQAIADKFPQVAEQASGGPIQNLAGGIGSAFFVTALAIVGVGVATKMFGLDLSMIGNPLSIGVAWLFSKSKTATEQVADTNAEILSELKKLNNKP